MVDEGLFLLVLSGIGWGLLWEWVVDVLAEIAEKGSILPILHNIPQLAQFPTNNTRKPSPSNLPPHDKPNKLINNLLNPPLLLLILQQQVLLVSIPIFARIGSLAQP